MSEILKKENILRDCRPEEKNVIISKMGEILFRDGYITREYIQGMLDKEQVFNTNIGNGVAIPHGIESARDFVLHSGICIMIFPEGTEWGNDEKVNIVIGIAGKEKDHIDILEKIAMTLSEPDEVEKLIQSDVDTIYRKFTED